MCNKIGFQASLLVIGLSIISPPVALASGIPCADVISQPGLVYMADGRDRDTSVSLRVTGVWPRKAGYEFGYMDGSIFSSVQIGRGHRQNLVFENGSLVDFAVRGKGADGIFGTGDDSLYRLSDPSIDTTQTYFSAIYPKRANALIDTGYSRLRIGWDINHDGVSDLALLLQTGRCDGSMHFVASAPVPVPAAVWLLGSGTVGMAAFLRRRKRA